MIGCALSSSPERKVGLHERCWWVPEPESSKSKRQEAERIAEGVRVSVSSAKKKDRAEAFKRLMEAKGNG